MINRELEKAMKKTLCVIILAFLLVGCSSLKEQPQEEPQHDILEETGTEDMEEAAGFTDIFKDADTVYFIQHHKEFTPDSTEPILQLKENGSFKLIVNLLGGFGTITGKYEADGNVLDFTVLARDYGGFRGEDTVSWTMSYTEDSLTITSIPSESGVLAPWTEVGSIFSLGDKPWYFDNPSDY
jgi:hypothetical protein